MRRLASIAVGLILCSVVAVVLAGSSAGKAPVYYVRGIFDNAAFAVAGEQVRIAGANVGSIKSLDVTAAKKAAVTLEIDDARFTPFYANAHCAIRPQSLIGEKYVDCDPGSRNTPALKKITSGPGTGTYYLPVTRTSSPIDSDIVQGISQEPIRQRFALILDELGTGLTARGSDLNQVILRADPALGKTDAVLKILAKQNRVLAKLASDGDAVLRPLAKVKQQLADWVVQANTTSVASASRAADISRSFHLFPSFLRQLRPLLVDLGKLADQGTPLMASLAQSAAAVGRQFQNLTPFARAARPALIALGNSSQKSQPNLIATIPLDRRLLRLGNQAEPTAKKLDALLANLNQTGAIRFLMRLLFYGTSVGNGFDSDGHYIRTSALVGDCTPYARRAVLGCTANFGGNGASDVSAAVRAASAKAVLHQKKIPAPAARLAQQATRSVDNAVAGTRPATGNLTGLLNYLMGSKQ